MEIAILFAMVIGLMLIGVPIAISLGMSSILFLLVLSDASLASIAQTLFQAMAGHYTLLAIPFFILASTFMSTGGVAKRIIRFSIAIVGHFSRWSGDCGCVCLYDVCSFVWIIACNRCGHWVHRHRGYASGWLYQRVRGWRDRQCGDFGYPDPTKHRDGGIRLRYRRVRWAHVPGGRYPGHHGRF